MSAKANELIGIFIAFLPLYVKIGSHDIGRVSKDNLFVIFSMLACLFFGERVRRMPDSLWAPFAYGVLVVVLNHWDPVSINVMFQSFYITAGMVFFFLYYERHVNDGIESLLNWMAIGCLIQCTFVFFDWIHVGLYQIALSRIYEMEIIRTDGMWYKTIGSLGNPNLLGAYVALTSMALLRKKWIWLTPLPVIVLAFCDSSMPQVAFAAGIAYFANSRFKLIPKLALYATTAGGMILTFFFTKGFDSGRFRAWREMFSKMDIEHLVLGKGPGWFPDSMFVTVNGQMIQEHNEFISAINVFGLFGIAVAVPAIWRFLNTEDTHAIFAAILFAAFCNAFGHFNMHQSTTVIIILVSAAICLAGGNKYVGNMDRKRT